MSDTQRLFGKILTSTEGERDAVHVAVAPMVAACLLGAGDHVGINSDGLADDKARGIGIVDPFLTVNVQPGERFFVFLYPNTITSLTHRWSHPAFPELVDISVPPVNGLAHSVSAEQAEAELRGVCDSWEGPSYDDLMEALRSGSSEGRTRIDEYGDTSSFTIGDEYLSMYGSDAHGTIPDHRRFWDLAEIVVGRRLDDRPQYFSCSC